MSEKRHALVCSPASTLDRGLRMKFRGDVDIARAQEQHRRYCQALSDLGFTMLRLPADEQHPDSVFVEDPAVIIEDTLIITRLFRRERSGEERRLEEVLTPFFKRISRIEPPGYVEGGDVLVADGKLYIGLSTRTNAEGAEQLARIAHDLCGYEADIFEIPKTYLHLKGEATFHRRASGAGQHIITASEEIAYHFSNSGCVLIETPPEERFGANCISQEGRMLVHAGRLRTKKILEEADFETRDVVLSEFEKIDGAMTCLSKIFLAA